jgi:hypothetical protein
VSLSAAQVLYFHVAGLQQAGGVMSIEALLLILLVTFGMASVLNRLVGR